MDHAPADALVAQIYSAACGRTSWEDALATLCIALGAWAIQLVAIDKRTGAILFSHIGGGASPADHLAYIRTYNRTDPRTPILLTFTTEGWLHCHEYISEEMVAVSPFYQDFLIPAGGRYASGTKIIDDDSLSVLIGMHRGIGSLPFDEIAIPIFEKLRVHLAEAVSIYRYLSARHFESSIGYAILDGLHHPALLIDTTRHIRFTNAAAKIALAGKTCCFDHGGVLGCVNVNDNNNLVAELLDLSHSRGKSPNSNRRYMRMHGASLSSPVGVCLSDLRPKEVMGAFGNSSLIMVVLHDTGNTGKPDPFLLAEVFDLTPAEVQIAMAITEGARVEEIAARRGVAAGTVRDQLKVLFSKTQTNRQTDLIRRLLALSPIG